MFRGRVPSPGASHREGRSPSVPATIRSQPRNRTGRPRDAPRRRTVRLTESRLQAMIKGPFEHHAGQISAKCCLKNTHDILSIKRRRIRLPPFAMTMEDAISTLRRMYIGSTTSFLSWVYAISSVAIVHCLWNLFAYWKLLLPGCFHGADLPMPGNSL